jgi:hypothetical protein
MNTNNKIRSIYFMLVFIIPLLLVVFPLDFITNAQQIEGATDQSNQTNANISYFSQALQNATQSVQDIQKNITKNIDPCKFATGPSSIAIDSRKISIAPEDAFLNVLIYDKNNCLVIKQVEIEVRYLGSGDQADKNLNKLANQHDVGKLAAEASTSLSQQNKDPANDGMPLVYNQTAINTFFSKSGIPIDKEGLYLVRASIPGEKDVANSWTLIDGVSFFHTSVWYSVAIAVGAFGLLMYLSAMTNKYSILGKYGREARFLLISVVVFSSISAFYFVTEELGIGAPVGLVKRPLINSTSISNIIPGSGGEQWMINIGGVRENNYQFGLQIPIYVFVFGIIGGYIRYLYNTTQSQSDIITKKLFTWNNVPGSEESSLKDFLKNKYKLEWITDQLAFTKDQDNKTLSLKDDKNNHFLSVTLEDDAATLSLKNGEEGNKKFIVKKENNDNTVYTEEFDPLKSPFYNSLRDIALILLAPLLAAAVWFLIIQNGIDPAKGIYVLAVISFAVGLATDNVVQTLVNFVSTNTRMRGTQTQTPSAPSAQ